jgi:hypothetical protein
VARKTKQTEEKYKYPPGGGRGAEAAVPAGAQGRTAAEMDEEGAAEATDIVPEGYKTQAEFLSKWLKTYALDAAADKHNRDEAIKDLEFVYVEQWDPKVRKEREEAGRPCLTINTLPQFIGQVVGDRRINEVQIKLIPDRAENIPVANVRAGIIKSIENASKAERVYDMCCEDQTACGISNFIIEMDYARNDVFEQDLFVRPLANPFAVTWDRMGRDITGKDAKHAFVEETIPPDVWKDEYPDVPVPSGFPAGVEGADWHDWSSADEGVKVVALWIMVEKPATFAMMSDGKVEDVTGKDKASYLERVFRDPQGAPMIRDGKRTYAQRWLITGFTILEGPYELPLSRLPVIKVSGRVGRIGTKQYRFGLTRWARDAVLMRNYWRSVAVETLAMAPKAQWTADAASVKGREDDFRAAHLSGDPLLIYNTGKNKPERVQQPELPAAVLNEAAMNTQDIKDVTGLQDASLGIRSNEVSGKAIMARQREGDVATITYHDNLNSSIEEAGVVLNELIPICYDTTRTVKVMGQGEDVKHMVVNDPANPDSIDITQGRYDVHLITGPSFTTQRQEAADSMLEAMKVMPEAMSTALDLIVEAQDWPDAQKIAARLKKANPLAQQEEQEKAQEQNGGQPSQEQQQAQAQQQQAEQLQQQVAQAAMQHEADMAAATLQEAQHKAREAGARADKAEADAEAAKQTARHKAVTAEAAPELAEADVRKATALAAEHESKAEKEDNEVVFHLHQRTHEVHHTAFPPEPSGDKQNSGGSTAKPRRQRKGQRK